ncbi:MAG: NAD(P)/FAD-dependent oxidoreductase, partial [Cereibacter changlensis]
HDTATAVDRERRSVTLTGGQSLAYDRLVLAPGIDFVEDAVPGWSLERHAEIMPHAYKAGPQTQLLKSMVEAMPQGGAFALVAPPDPYRCPPGPYERVSMIATLFKRTNPTAKILIIDPKEGFSKQTLFENAWLKYYDGMIDWIGPDFGGDLVEVRPETMELVIDGEVQKVDACNVIPAQVAGRIAAAAGVTDDSGWAPVAPESLRSKIDEAVFVLGDSALQGDMPKSASAANSQAAVVVRAIRADLLGTKLRNADYANTCWSLLAPDDGVKVGGAYEATPEKIASVHHFISEAHEDAALRKATYEESIGWYDGITADIFG